MARAKRPSPTALEASGQHPENKFRDFLEAAPDARMAGLCGEIEALARNATFDGILPLLGALDDEFARVCRALRLEQGVEL